MAKEPTKHYEYRVMEDTKYYRKVPGEGAKPDGVFKVGTRVSKFLDHTAGYNQVESDTGVEAWISSKSPLLHIFRPTHETTGDTPYWFFKTPDEGSFSWGATPPSVGMEIANIIRMPLDGTLPEGTKVAIWTHVGSETPVIRWTEGGPTVVIDTRKSPLKPLKRGLKMHREELLGR